MLQRVDPSPDGIRLQTTLASVDDARRAIQPPGSEAIDSTDEFRSLLQRRIAAMWPYGTVILGIFLLLNLFGDGKSFIEPAPQARGKTLIGVAFACFLLGSIVARLRTAAPLHWLRGVEWATVLSVAAVLADMRVEMLRVGFAYGETEPSRYFLNWVLTFNAFGWMCSILMEGIAIPNTWRRACLFTAILATVPLLVDAGFLLAWPDRWRLLAVPEFVTVQFVGFAALLALFGSHKLEAMRQAVIAARREVKAARAVGPYLLGERLGAGGMGEVYRAEHRLLKRSVAVKLIRPESSTDKNALARFEREAQATARLRHPNTVEVFDFGRTDDGAFYYVMEYLDGVNLTELVTIERRLPPGRVVSILRPLCGALAEAHAAGLIHRDIKPSNVLLCEHGGRYDVVKLVDFGVVGDPTQREPDSRLTEVGAVIGTPAFMSPEQANGTSLDATSDLYSLGATAFYLLTGQPPFDRRTTLDILFAHRQDPIPSLKDLVPDAPDELDAIVRRCLAKSPVDRYPNAEALDAALSALPESWSPEDARQWWQRFRGKTSTLTPVANAATN